MSIRPALFAAALAAAGGVAAQQEWTEIEDELAVVQALAMTVGELEGAAVHSLEGERIGELDEVMVEQGGERMVASLDVGGFLGIGEKDVLVPIEELTASADGIVIQLTKSQLEAMPEYED